MKGGCTVVLRAAALACAFAGLLACATPAAAQVGGFVPELPDIKNYVAVGIGVMPDYMGSNDSIIGIGPAGKIGLGGQRYVRFVATEVSVNLLNDFNWSVGPAVNYRFGRGSEVEDAAVSRMREIDGAFEAGAFVGWRWVSEADQRQQFSISLLGLRDVSGSHDGFVVTPSLRYFHPVSRAVTLSLGASTTYGDKSYTNSFFGVDAGNAALSGLPAFAADGGMRDLSLSPIAILSLSESWHLAGGAIVRKLFGDAADSPIVRDRGSDTQLLAGFGIAYAW